MATVYSLICWGGKAGKAVTGSSAATDRITIVKHGLRTGMGVQFTAGTLMTGAAPSALALNTTYYARYYSADEFTLHTSEAGAIANTGQITWTVAGSGLTLKGAYYQGLSDVSRWTNASVECVYDSAVSFISGRTSAASAFDVEYAEVGEEFNDYINNGALLNLNLPCAQTVIRPMVNGVRTSGWHGGNTPPSTMPTDLGVGYALVVPGTISSADAITFSRYNDVIEGIIVSCQATFGVGSLVKLSKGNAGFERCFVIGSGTYPTGVNLNAPLARAVGNVVLYCATGVNITAFMPGILVANNTVSRCTTGFVGPTTGTGLNGFFYNNIAVGNTTNWNAASMTGTEGASNNAGLSGEAWIVGAGTRVTMATTDFADYTNNDLSPAASTSPQVNAGVNFFGFPTQDIADGLRPAYEDGTDVIDIGAFEWDFGNTPPLTCAATFSGIKSGTEIRVYQDDTGTELAGVESCSADHALSWTAYPLGNSLNNVTIRIISTTYENIEFPYVSSATTTSIPVQQRLQLFSA